MSAEPKRVTKTEVWVGWENQVVNGAYPLRRFLGGSNHSAVFLTEYRPEGATNAAIKLVPADTLETEAQLVQWGTAATLNHPHLIRLFDVGRCHIGGRVFLYVVMEYADQTLAELLPRRALTPDETRDMLISAISALNFLHRNRLVQGQVKPTNLLVVGDQLKLASDTIRSTGKLPSGILRTSLHDPPELKDGEIAPAGDIWGLGVTLVEALTQHPPSWPDARSETVSLTASIPPLFVDTVQRCLNRNPANRPTAAELQGQFDPAVHAHPITVVTAEEPVYEVSTVSTAAESAEATRSRTGAGGGMLVLGVAAVLVLGLAIWVSRTIFVAQFEAAGAGPAVGPVAEAGARPAADVAAGPVVGVAARPVAGVAAGPVAGVAAGPVAGVAAGPVAGSAAGPVAGVAAGPVAGAAAGPVAGAAARPVAGIAARPVVGVAARPVVGIAARPVAGAGARPVAGIAAGPVTGAAGEPTAGPAGWNAAGTAAGSAAAGTAASGAGPVAGPAAGSVAGPAAGSVTGTAAGSAAGSAAASTGPSAKTSAVGSSAAGAGPAAGSVGAVVSGTASTHRAGESQIAARESRVAIQSAPPPTPRYPRSAKAIVAPASADALSAGSDRAAQQPEIMGSVLEQKVPDIPRSIREKIRGHVNVTVRVLVDPAGNVVGEFLENSGPSRYFARQAGDAATEWKFVPSDGHGPRVWMLKFEFTRVGATVRAVGTQ